MRKHRPICWKSFYCQRPLIILARSHRVQETSIAMGKVDLSEDAVKGELPLSREGNVKIILNRYLVFTTIVI